METLRQKKAEAVLLNGDTEAKKKLKLFFLMETLRQKKAEAVKASAEDN